MPAPASGGGLTSPSPVLIEGRHWKRSRSAIVTVLSVSIAVAARSTLRVSFQVAHSWDGLATYRGTTASPRRSLAIMASFQLGVS